MKLVNTFRKAVIPFVAFVENKSFGKTFLTSYRFSTDKEAEYFVYISRLKFKNASR